MTDLNNIDLDALAAQFGDILPDLPKPAVTVSEDTYNALIAKAEERLINIATSEQYSTYIPETNHLLDILTKIGVNQ